jgi:hypothetical protein
VAVFNEFHIESAKLIKQESGLRVGIAVLLGIVCGASGCDGYLNSTGPNHCGSVDGYEVWGKISNPHLIECSTTINGEVLIPEGITVKFADGAELIVAGGLQIEGTSEDPVEFVASGTGGFPGLAIRGNGGDTVLRHLRVDGGGFSDSGAVGGITIDSGPVMMDNVTIENAFDCGLLVTNKGRIHASTKNISIRNSGGAAVCTDVQAAQTVRSDAFESENNGQAGNRLFGDKLVGVHRWTNTDQPYVVSETFSIMDGDLTIGPGVELQFESYYSLLVGENSQDINAALTIAGEADNPVLLTGTSDNRGSWGGVHVLSSAGIGRVSLSHATLSNGGSVSGYGSAMLSTGDDVQVAVQEVELTGAETMGFSFGNNAGFTQDSGSIRVTGNAFVGKLDADMVGSIPETAELSGNDDDTVDVLSSLLHQSTTWRNLGAAYSLLEGLETGNHVDGVSLTIEAGVTLEFAEDTEMELGDQGPASSYFAGTEDNPVLLHPAASGERGSWGGVQFAGGLGDDGVEWSFVDVVGGGDSSGAGLRVDGASIELQDVQVSGSAGYGVRIRSGGFSGDSRNLTVTDNAMAGTVDLANVTHLPTEGCDYTGNDVDEMYVTSSLLDEDATIWGLGIPYMMSGTLQIRGTEETPTQLDLEAGADLRFGSATSLLVDQYGGLQIKGTAERPVTLLPQEESVAGSWRGLEFKSTAEAGLSILQHFELGYAGANKAAIQVYGGDPFVAYGYVHDSECYAVYVPDASSATLFIEMSYENNFCGDYTNVYP